MRKVSQMQAANMTEVEWARGACSVGESLGLGWSKFSPFFLAFFHCLGTWYCAGTQACVSLCPPTLLRPPHPDPSRPHLTLPLPHPTPPASPLTPLSAVTGALPLKPPPCRAAVAVLAKVHSRSSALQSGKERGREG